ncbi:type II secretion system protein XpsH [Pseudoxanthomonas suwonensis]|uniref:Type II secretion system protein H n=1 Tax=Pseudoxanthomonas suwonensis TaxID=314722 RepID=A0A0E3Z5G8_9GAMM|nr:GspH/FimT family pseudopilin [Pseudoxanthomonas suwonensis]AKC88049.1 general secretion pathway protein GspH [Pseudoxanthomonas suwonensis]
MSTRARRGRADGMSLIELLLVMALVALAGTLAVAVYSGGLEGVRMRSSAKEIAAQLRYTRAQAIASGQVQRFEIDPLQRRWQAAGGRQGRLPESLEVDFIGAREVQPRPGTGAIVFFEDGGSTGGRVRLESGGAIWQVDVAWLTGEVTLSRPSVEGAR